MSPESPEPSRPSRIQPKTRQLNDSLHELYKPVEVPSMQIVFFPGLQLGDQADPYLWESADGSTRLVDEFPSAHILSFLYPRNMEERAGNVDSYVIGENLLSDLITGGQIGQVRDCPVILVGYAVEELLIKQICLQAYEKVYLSKGRERTRLNNFLDNVKGIFCYTRTESPNSGNTKKVFELLLLLSHFESLFKEAERINFRFAGLRQVYSKWKIKELFEDLHVNSGLCSGTPEASSREGETFNVAKEEDHLSLTKPSKIPSRIFYAFVDFLRPIEIDMKEARPENLQYLPENITGIDTQLQGAKAQLEKSRTLGFVGMGGVGKTTLAKALFNELIFAFEYTCFLPDLRFIIGRVDEAEKIVWEDMHYCGKRVREKEESVRLRERSLLLVLDDISSDRDLEVLMAFSDIFSDESRFIVTSRNRDLSSSLEDYYEIPFLDFVNSQKLFTSWAFAAQETVPSELESLVEAIVKKCNGLPLALEVIGKYLFKRDRDYWKPTLDALQAAEHFNDFDDRLWAVLRRSYDSLDEQTKQMFLDVATFYSGNEHWTLSDAKTTWETVYSIVGLRWQTLVERSLVYDVKEDESIKVHAQLQSLGKRIASEYKFYRIWDEATMSTLLQQPDEFDEQDIHALLLGKTGDDHEGNKIEEVRIPNLALQRLKNLRFLDVNIPIIIEGAQESELFPTRLALLHCDARSGLSRALLHPVLSNTLAVLRLSWQKDLCLPESIWYFSALKSLILSSATYLKSLPNQIGRLSQLENLELRGCPCLETLPETFGRLSNLSRLLLYDCENLHNLPESFGQLSALRRLDFEKCKKLQSLPESFGRLSALRHLGFKECENLHSLPISFGQLSALSYLKFESCHSLRSLPESFGQLSALTHLDFEKCKNLQSLPESFGQLSALSHLEVKECGNFHLLPESFGSLCSLSQLKLWNCENLHSLPESFAYLSSLSHLEFVKCHSLRALPDSFKHLSALSYLRFEDWEDSQCSPDSLRKLKALQLSTSLKTAHETVSKDGFQIWNETTEFNPLQLHEEDEFDEQDVKTPQLESQVVNSEEVHDEGTKLQSLKKSQLIIDGAQSMKDFSASAYLNVPEYLVILNCPDLIKLGDNISQLQNVRYLEIQDCKSLTEIPEFLGELKGLEQLIIKNCPYLLLIPETIGHLRFLRYLKIQDCADLTNLPKLLGELRGLQQLIIWNCPSLVGIPDTVKHLEALQLLRIQNCENLKDLPASVGKLQCLEQLLIWSCPGLLEIPDTIGGFGALRNLRIQDCKNLVIDSEALGRIEALEYVAIYSCFNVILYLKTTRGDVSMVLKSPVTQDRSRPNVDKSKSAFIATKEVVQCEQEVLGNDGRSVLDLTRRAEELRREVEEGGEDGYFISSKGLLSLEESQRQSLMLTFWEAGYSEIYQTTTTTLFAKVKRGEENLITYYDASSGFEEKIISLGDDDDDEVRASKRDDDVLEYEGTDVNLDVKAKNIAGSFKAAIPISAVMVVQVLISVFLNYSQLTGKFSGYWKIIILSGVIFITLESVFRFFSFYRSVVRLFSYRSIRVRKRNPGGGGLSDDSSSSSSKKSDVARGGTKFGSSVSGSSLSSRNGKSNVDNSDNTNDSLFLATTERRRNDEESLPKCHPLRLKVAWSSTARILSSISREQSSEDGTVQFGPEIVTMPNLQGRSAKKISVAIDRRFSVPAVVFSSEGKATEVTMSMNAKAETSFTCCLKIDDHQPPIVRIKLTKISGEVESRDLNKEACNVVILSCVGTTVYGCTRRTENEAECDEIALDLDDEYRRPRGRVVRSVRGDHIKTPDLVWLEISSNDAKNSKPGSITVGLRGDVDERREEDKRTYVQRAHTLSFYDTTRPVTFEGNIDEDIIELEASFSRKQRIHEFQMTRW